jgi:HD-like signal output (HDOD) protein
MRAVDRDTPLYNELIAVDALPPMPATASKLLLMATDPDVDINDLAVVIERDPPLASRLIGVANSAFYAPRQPVTSVREAIIRVLGLNMVRNMAFGMALAGGLSTAACPRFDLTAYWVTALGTAEMAAGLARAANIEGMVDPDTAYLAGLLHNIGELLLVHLFPQKMAQALEQLADSPGSTLAEQMHTVIGIDQWAAGAFLMRHWQLPPVIASTIEGMADPGAVPRNRPLATLLDATRRWIQGLIAGRVDALEVDGVDASYSDYRTTLFGERFEDLRHLAKSMH